MQTGGSTEQGLTAAFDGSRMRRRELLTIVSAIMALMALAIDMMLPAFDEIREAFGLDPESTRVSQVITVFFLGLAVAQLVWGPLADRFGRKPILYLGMAVYVLGAVGSVLATSFEFLLLSRFVWGVGAAGSRVVATAIVRDVFEGSQMAKALSQIMAVFVLVPVFAPALGAGLMAVLPWRSIFWFCLVWAALITWWSRRLPETLDPQSRRPLEFRSLLSGFAHVSRNRMTRGYTLATLFLQGIFTAYLGSSERIISDIFGREGQFPFIFGAVAILFGVAALMNGALVGRIGVVRSIHLMFGAAVTIATALVLVTVVSSGRPSFWVFMPMFALLLSTFMFLMPNLNTGALQPMGELAGTASSLTGASRIAGGAILGAIVDSQVGDTVTPFVVGALIFIVCAIASVVSAGSVTLD